MYVAYKCMLCCTIIDVSVRKLPIELKKETLLYRLRNPILLNIYKVFASSSITDRLSNVKNRSVIR